MTSSSKLGSRIGPRSLHCSCVCKTSLTYSLSCEDLPPIYNFVRMIVWMGGDHGLHQECKTSPDGCRMTNTRAAAQKTTVIHDRSS
jgi:hypothetical protein